MMLRFSTATRQSEVVSSGRPIQLFEVGFVSRKTSVQDHQRKQFASNLCLSIRRPHEVWIQEHMKHQDQAREAMQEYALTSLEAEAIVWGSADLGVFGESQKNGLTSSSKALFASGISLASFAGRISPFTALQKLPAVKAITFRGENKRFTLLSRQFRRGNQVS